MIFERGPRAFVKATYQTLTRLRSNESPTQYILHSASDMVSTKLAVLTNMQHCLAAFLAEVCLVRCLSLQMLMSSRIKLVSAVLSKLTL